MSASNDEPSHDGDWGWEPLGSEDEEPQNAQGVLVQGKNESGSTDAADGKPSMNKRNSSEKSLSAKRGSFTGQKSLPGIVSSPSFLELEKAIGATLNLASNDSGDLGDNRQQSPTTTFPPSRLSSTNLTQQKVNQQRIRQQQHQGQRYSSQNQYSRSPAAGSYSYNNIPNGYAPMPPPMPQLQHLPVPARIELAPFINEGESRAIVLFHSLHVSTADIRNACSKHGVLYYIRPEFHGKGVTLISYFDLRAASSAKACIAEDLGASAEASAHYSVMLHAANGNSEEFRLVVRNLPVDSCSEAEVEAIFARYGQLRSIQKTFEQQNDKSLPSSPSSKEGRSEESERASSEGTDSNKSKRQGADDGAADQAAAAAVSSSPPSPTSPEMTPSGANNNNNQNNCKIAYSIEYYNIQDARLAASELSATSAQQWNAEVTVKFAPLDERKQQLCRQLLATLSRWRSEMAAMASSSAMSYNFNMHHHQQQQQQYGTHMNMTNMNMNMNMGMMGLPAGGMGVGYSMAQQQQQQQQQASRYGLGLGLGAGMTVGTGLPMMGGATGFDGSVSYFDPTSAYYPQQQQQQMYMQQQQQQHLSPQQQQQMQQYMASATAAMAGLSGRGGGADPNNSNGNGVLAMPHQQQQQQHQQAMPMPMPMSVQAMAGLMYATAAAEGAEGGGNGGVARASPMQSLMPANLSNPNLFNFGLLAAQAEAQMQQQQQQQMLGHYQQQQQQQQQQLSSQDANGGDSATSNNSWEVDAQQRPGFQMYQQHQLQTLNPSSVFQGANSNNNNNRYGQHQYSGGNTQRSPQHLQQQQLQHQQQQGGRGPSVPPHHQQHHHHQNGAGGGGGPFPGGAPLHHHQQHHQQLQYNNNTSNGNVSNSQQLARRGGGGKAPPGAGAGAQYPYSPYAASAAIGGGGGAGAGAGAGVSSGRSGGEQHQQQQHDTDFALDLKRIGADEETRTTVMVRNIPNKYNQQMLLEEVNVGHEGTYDFFYLPIDFKNRCNVGYCFINFLDPKHIPPFVHAFHGQRWKSFNSEKVCAVTFARIQGKQAMISRFQNSSLLEKDDEYQPLLFYSSGPDRGKPEPFPASNNARRTQQQTHQAAHPHPQYSGHAPAPGTYSSQTSPIQSHSQSLSQSQSQNQSQSQSQTASPASTSRSITPPPPPSTIGTPRSLHHSLQHGPARSSAVAGTMSDHDTAEAKTETSTAATAE
eukprot:gene8150-9706_t